MLRERKSSFAVSALVPAFLGTALLLIAAAAPLSAAEIPPADETTYPLTAADHQLLDDIERAAFRFFVEQADPKTGLVRDRARADGSPSEGKASIAASGFALSAWVIATERGWVSRDEALVTLRRKLRFLAEQAPRRHGFFYHFMEMETGARAWECELSSIDSALLFAGLITAREYFADPEITALAQRLLGEIDWAWFRNGGGLIALGWHDETGFSRYRWDHFSEHLLLSFLALGASPQPVEPAYWQRWTRRPIGRYGNFVYLQEPPLFIYQFPLAYMDLRQRRDAYADYFHNARLATLAQRQFALDHRAEFPQWGENLWGLTASDSVNGYKAWGAPPRTAGYNQLDGTIVPCAAAGSLPFAPAETLAVLHHLKATYGDRLWQRYGFVDAFNPHNDWVNPDILGIDQGITMLMAENVRSGLIWRLFMRSPEARLGLAQAGLLSTSDRLDPSQQATLLATARAAWTALADQPAPAGLQLTATLAAWRAHLLDDDAFLTLARAQLAAPLPAADPVALAEYAAALITLRQASPALATDATVRLAALDWSTLPASTTPVSLGSAARLTRFLQIAAGLAAPSTWAELTRTTTPLGVVHPLAPVDIAGAVRPALWLDETAILPGASASQLAYATLTAPDLAPALRDDPFLSALQLAHFPRETTPSTATHPAALAAQLITATDLLARQAVRPTIRDFFQRDPLVQTGRAAIAEFTRAEFGPHTSVVAQRELSGEPPLPPARRARALAAATPRDQWDWQTVSGSQFQNTATDIHTGDATLSFRFALTWDADALHFHAEVTDQPPGTQLPAIARRFARLLLDLTGDGYRQEGPDDFSFCFLRAGDWNGEPDRFAPSATLTPTPQGYTITAAIPWTRLGLTPAPGLVLGLNVGAVAEGTKEWEPRASLDWSFARPEPGQLRLGRLRLE